MYCAVNIAMKEANGECFRKNAKGTLKPFKHTNNNNNKPQ